MKRQTQVPGVRRWYGDDFLELQSEALNAIDAVVGAYNKPCVISGCEYASGQLTKGFVALSVQNEGLKIMPFDGVVIALPCHLTAVKTLVNTVYADGVARLSAYQYKAIATTPTPEAGVNYIKIEANGKCDRLPDIMQDAAHRMVSDTEKTAWNAKETPTGAQIKATKAAESAINAANTYTDQARREARDYTDVSKQVAVDTALEQAKQYTDDVAATKAEALIELPEAPQVNRNATWFYKPSGTNHGRNVYFGDDVNGFQLTANEGFDILQFRNKKDGEFLPQHRLWSNRNFNPADYVEKGTLPVYSIMEVYSAGKIASDGSVSTLYKGAPVTTKKTATNTYRVTHSLGNGNYMVNITPIGNVARSFTINIKSTSFFEVLFDSAADFEFQILKY